MAFAGRHILQLDMFYSDRQDTGVRAALWPTADTLPFNHNLKDLHTVASRLGFRLEKAMIEV
jgi:hypothetical protein